MRLWKVNTLIPMISSSGVVVVIILIILLSVFFPQILWGMEVVMVEKKI
jgi:hypothetical protein